MPPGPPPPPIPPPDPRLPPIPLESPDPPRPPQPRRGMPDVHCLNCGYALKGSPTPVCPECGHEWRFGPHERLTRLRYSPRERAAELRNSIFCSCAALAVLAWAAFTLLNKPILSPAAFVTPGILAIFGALLLWRAVEGFVSLRRGQRSRRQQLLDEFFDDPSD